MQEQSFGYWLRRRRKALDLTREALAARVGCSAATIRKLEAEERRPSAQIVGLLAEIFNIPVNERAEFLRFARGDWQSAPDEAAEEPPWQTPIKKPRSNLPSLVTSLIGRDEEITAIRAYLRNPEIRLISLTGPPGIGKTRLSLETARAMLSDFPDGLCFVSLATIDDPSLLPSTILKALGFVETKKSSASQQLGEDIAAKRMLLILDNCEHLIGEVALLLSNLLSACPHLNILTTSREALRVHGEWLFVVKPLGLPKEVNTVTMESAHRYPALGLFVERARAVRFDFQLEAENVQAVASICARLDGLPLAIELIAAQVRFMSPEVLLASLSDQMVLSTGGMRATPVRQKSLQEAIGWSYNLLTPEEQYFFANLSVFSGGFTAATAAAIVAGRDTGKPVPDLITSFVDKSLLEYTVDHHGQVRFDMLVVIQKFALNILRNEGGETAARNRHLAYFLDFAEKGDQEIRGANQADWGNRLEIELHNFRAALEWGVSTQDTSSVLRLLGALGWAWEVSGHYKEARCWLERIRSLPAIQDHPILYTRVLNHIGRHSWTQESFQDARQLLEESRAIAQKAGEVGERSLADTLIWLGMVALYGDQDEKTARIMFEQSLELYQKWRNPWGIAIGTFHLGILESDLKHGEAARALLEKSLTEFKKLGDHFFISRVSIFLGQLFFQQGDLEKALLFLEQNLKIDTELQYWDGMAEGWHNLEYFYRQQDMHERARQCHEQCLSICREHGLDKPFLLPT